ncbi:MAG: hypothetical protein PHU46_08125 [Rhodocyclaceae bacterium]|nr:hypothetical protein [Rhodocyclaceae bacterium]
MAANTQLILDTEGAGLSAQVFFNDILLSQDEMPERLTRSARLNGWAVSGNNTLSVRLSAPPPARPDAPPRPSPRYALRLRQLGPGNGERLLEDFTWNPAGQPLAPGGGVEALSRSYPLEAVAPWAWTRATPIPQLGQGDTQAIGSLLAALHGALASRAIPDVVKLQAVQVGEQAVAVGEDPRSFLQRYAEFLQERMASPDWTVRPVVWERLRASSMAGGRLHHVTDAAGKPPLVALSRGSTFAIDPYVARIGGVWTICR